jgi:hypothetical protein
LYFTSASQGERETNWKESGIDEKDTVDRTQSLSDTPRKSKPSEALAQALGASTGTRLGASTGARLNFLKKSQQYDRQVSFIALVIMRFNYT